jgi:hypothetical protein
MTKCTKEVGGYCYRLRAIKAAREAQDAKYKALRKFIAR